MINTIELDERDDVTAEGGLGGNLDAKVGFNIGWDAYSEGFSLVSWVFKNKDISMGWKAAQAQNIKRNDEEPNRYIRKLLRLRLNAWKRNRQFNVETVNENFLRYIDVSHCPITLEKLTHSEGVATDWSIDRINNNAAYSCGNLAVMSTRANIAKTNFSFDKISDFAYKEGMKLPTALHDNNGEFKKAIYKSGAGTNTLTYTYKLDTTVLFNQIHFNLNKVYFSALKLAAKIVDCKISASRNNEMLLTGDSITVDVTFDQPINGSNDFVYILVGSNALTPLTREEWARMAVICSQGPCGETDDGLMIMPKRIVPFIINTPPATSYNLTNVLQRTIAYKALVIKYRGHASKGHKMYCDLSDALVKKLDASGKKEINKLIERAARYIDCREPLAIWKDRALFLSYVAFYKKLTEEQFDELSRCVEKSPIYQRRYLDRDQGLHLETKGYAIQ